MDWSKSKSIFIVVFLIINVFLYSLYLNRHTEAQQFEVVSEKKIEARLKDDNITYEKLPLNIDTVSYISAKVKDFSKEELELPNAEIIPSGNVYKLKVMLEEPVKIKNPNNTSSFNDFLQTSVYNGSSYVLWEIDEEGREARFFQEVDGKPVYYNINGMLSVHWNDEDEIISYEQTMLEEIEKLEEKKQLHQPIEVIQVLSTKRMLQPNSEIIDMNLGYSTLVQSTQTQVFVPTWAVQVETEDGTVKEFFVNATEGKIIDIQLDFFKNLEEEREEELEEVNEVNEIKMEVSRE